ncbi:uncharacterized protein BP5553_07572 [Venustampulla echinocandica]|uniref:Uncharacterized protein n=1 Tax=Venustampulla echinocandica TaxID=2656787 RepID=A0A370TGW7_9HELO|nr:uncharacterized protein BP5553_07572 [Venustampulla echinocandica]RDL34444.1 hypothetical protein BP5553_07572 [Venustampulla echinocandica]
MESKMLCRSDSESFSLSISQRSPSPPPPDYKSHYHCPPLQSNPPMMFLPPSTSGGPPRPINVSKPTGSLRDLKLIPPRFELSDSESVTGNSSRSKDALELIYNIRTSTFRRALRSELLRERTPPAPPSQQENRGMSGLKKRKATIADGQGHGDFFYLDNFNPPLLVDGRKTVMPLPRFKRTVKVYYRRSARATDREKDAPPVRGETEVIIRRLKLPISVWFQRNVLGQWEELWVEMC